MPWARLDDQFYNHPKLPALGSMMLPCVGLHVLALCYANAYLTDGFIPKDQVPRLSGDLGLLLPEGHPWGLVERLCAVGLWHENGGSGYMIHDFLKYNPSRRQALRERKQNGQRQHRFRTTRRNAHSNAVTNTPVTAAPSPSPSPSLEEEKKTGLVLSSPNRWGTPERLMELYNRLIPQGHPKVTRLTPARRKKAQKYLAMFPEERFWTGVFSAIQLSSFLRGLRPSNGHEGFKGDFDWLLTQGKDGTENCAKVEEGRYQDAEAR